MPSGAEAFQKHVDVISARRGAGGDFPQINFFQIAAEQVARVRFLEQGNELTWAQSHRVKNAYGFFDDLICLDQTDDGTPCPACQSDIKEIRYRSSKGYVNVLWRGSESVGAEEYVKAPVYKRNDKGRIEKDAQKQKIITGFEDSVWLWKCSKSVFEQLLEKDTKYKGIMSRDFAIKRKGATKDNTLYFLEPAFVDGGPEPMSVADGVLSQAKYDVVNLTTPESFSDMAVRLTGQQSAQDINTTTFPRGEPSQADVFNGQTPMRSSAFNR